MIALGTYMKTYRVGDIVDIKANGAVQKGVCNIPVPINVFQTAPTTEKILARVEKKGTPQRLTYLFAKSYRCPTKSTTERPVSCTT